MSAEMKTDIGSTCGWCMTTGITDIRAHWKTCQPYLDATMTAEQKEIAKLRKLLERAAIFIDTNVDHYPCEGADDARPCTCGKRAILAEIDSQFTRSDA